MSMKKEGNGKTTLTLRGKDDEHWTPVYEGFKIANDRHMKKNHRPLSLTAYLFDCAKKRRDELIKEEAKKEANKK